jgi:hypothetical protein
MSKQQHDIEQSSSDEELCVGTKAMPKDRAAERSTRDKHTTHGVYRMKASKRPENKSSAKPTVREKRKPETAAASGVEKTHRQKKARTETPDANNRQEHRHEQTAQRSIGLVDVDRDKEPEAGTENGVTDGESHAHDGGLCETAWITDDGLDEETIDKMMEDGLRSRGKMDGNIKWSGSLMPYSLWEKKFAPAVLSSMRRFDAREMLSLFRDPGSASSLSKSEHVVRFVVSMNSTDVLPVMVYESMEADAKRVRKCMPEFTAPYYPVTTLGLFYEDTHALFFKRGEVRVGASLQMETSLSSRDSVRPKAFSIQQLNGFLEYSRRVGAVAERPETLSGMHRRVPVATENMLLNLREHGSMSSHHLLAYCIHEMCNTAVLFVSDMQCLDLNPLMHAVVRGYLCNAAPDAGDINIAVCVHSEQTGDWQWHVPRIDKTKARGIASTARNSCYLEQSSISGEGDSEFPPEYRRGTYAIIADELVPRQTVVALLRRFEL